MSDKTGIEWTDATWNPTTGCDQVSPGCDHCYALTMAKRLKAMGSPRYQNDGDPATSGPGFGLTMHPDALDQPLRWTKPRRIFVNSMSDLFHKDVTDEFLAMVWAVMALAPQHTFQVLTKRHGRMRALVSSEKFEAAVARAASHLIISAPVTAAVEDRLDAAGWMVDVVSEEEELWEPPWPLPNVWLGVSVEDQHWADIRVPALLDTPAAVRFLSCEPLLGPVSFRWAPWAHFINGMHLDGLIGIDWVIVGGESGPGSRPVHPDWPRALRDQCVEAGVAFHFKQWGEWVTEDQSPEDITLPAVSYSHFGDDEPSVYKVGKHAAGRELDGRTWDEYPTEIRSIA